MDVPYLFKINLWMSASDEATLKKNFGGINPWPSKKMVPQLWLLWWFSKLWSVLQINILKKKLHFELSSLSHTGNVCYHYNTWVTDVYIAHIFDRNSGGKTSQIEWLFESNLRSLGYFKCSSAFAFFWIPALKATRLLLLFIIIALCKVGVQT